MLWLFDQHTVGTENRFFSRPRVSNVVLSAPPTGQPDYKRQQRSNLFLQRLVHFLPANAAAVQKEKHLL